MSPRKLEAQSNFKPGTPIVRFFHAIGVGSLKQRAKKPYSRRHPKPTAPALYNHEVICMGTISSFSLAANS